MTENEISNKVIGIAIEVHNALGPGLLENTYKVCLYYKLVQAGFKVEKRKINSIDFRRSKTRLRLQNRFTC